MTEPEPAANPQAQVTEEIVLPAEYIAAAPYDSSGSWVVVGWLFRSRADGEAMLRHAVSIIEAAKTRPAADRGQIVEECARVADRAKTADENHMRRYPDEHWKFEDRAHRAGTIAAAIRALSTAPAQTEE